MFKVLKHYRFQIPILTKVWKSNSLHRFKNKQLVYIHSLDQNLSITTDCGHYRIFFYIINNFDAYTNMYLKFRRPASFRGYTCEFADRFAVTECHFDFRHKWIPRISLNDFNEVDDRWSEVRKFDILEWARSLS